MMMMMMVMNDNLSSSERSMEETNRQRRARYRLCDSLDPISPISDSEMSEKCDDRTPPLASSLPLLEATSYLL
jgi:hypothetical protein